VSIDAIALLPPLALPSSAQLEEEEGWFTVTLSGMPAFPFKPLKDGTLVMLGLRFAYPDEALYDQCAAWLSHASTLPSRVWVFPDTVDTVGSTVDQVLTETRGGGRWIHDAPEVAAAADHLVVPTGKDQTLLEASTTSIGTVAWLPKLELPSDVEREEKDGWFIVNLPDLPRLPFKPRTDETLAELGLPFDSPDKDLYERCNAWLSRNGYRPGRIWVFPSTAVSSISPASHVLTATQEVGRWIDEPRKKQRPVFDFLGLTRAEGTALLNEIMSGDAARIAAAKKSLENRYSEAELEAALQRFLEER